MVSLSVARSINTAFTSTYRPVALFVGGTSGIGEGTAQALARATKGNAHILICGRNKANAERIIETFPKTDGSTYEFIECDATLMKNVSEAAALVKSKTDRLNFLVLSQGIMTLRGRTETEEGIDEKLALHFYGRWKFVDELLPLLQKAKSEGQEARVMSVFSAGYGPPLDVDDLGLKKKYSITAAANQATTANDLMTDEYSKRYPNLSFMHTFPGGVNTPLVTTNLHWSMNIVSSVLGPFITSITDCGEWMAYGLLNPAYRQGGFFLDNHGDPVSPAKVKLSDEARAKLVEHYNKEVNV